MLDRGIIEESNSACSSALVLVTKKDGSQIICVDYRMFNAVAVPSAFPLPRIDGILDALSGAKWFATLDLDSGYWQVPMNPSSSDKTAFVTDFGRYDWTAVPMGLASAPSNFERLMESCVKGTET